MPRIKADRDRGYIGAWMRRERLSREWSPEEVVERLAGRGYVVRVDYYRQIEAGPKTPGEPFLKALQDVFGSEPEPLPEPAPSPTLDPADIVAAIRELVEAVDRQSEALATRDRRLLALIEGLGATIGAQRDGNGHPVPDGVGQ